MHIQTTAVARSSDDAAHAPPDDPRRWWILAACCVVGFAQLAEPQLWMIGFNIPASAFGTAWRGYQIFANLGVVLFIAFQLVGGVLGDLLGRRRIFLIGAVGSTVCNLLSLAAWNIASLVVARALVGVMGALVFPLTLAVVRLVFVGRERPLALMIYTFVTAVGTLASLLAIPLEDWFGWRWALVVPIGFGAAGIALAWRYLPESRAAGGIRRVEAITVAAWTLVLLALSFGLAVAHTHGTLNNPITLASAVAGMLGLAVIGYWRRLRPRRRNVVRRSWLPLLALSLLLYITATLTFALNGYVLQLYQFFHTVQQYHALVSGVALAPILLANAIVARRAARFAIEGPKHVVVASGLAAMGIGMLLTALLRPGLPYLLLIPGMALFGIGFLLAATAWTYFYFNVMPQDLIGVSAGINRAAGLVGGALASVVLSTVLQFSGMADFERRLDELELTPTEQAQALNVLEYALQLGHPIDETTQAPETIIKLALLAAYREAYSVGVGSALATGATLCLVSAVIVWLWLRRATPAAYQPVEQPALDDA